MRIRMKYFTFLLLLSGCFAGKASNELDELGEEVIKKKEGIDIRITPIEEEKHNK